MSLASNVEQLRQPSYTPPRRELDALITLYLAAVDSADERIVATALRRTATDAFTAALSRLPQTERPHRAHLVNLCGRLLATIVEQKGAAAPLGDFLPLVFDDDPTAARQAVTALGKLPPELSPLVEPVLLERFAKTQDSADQRALAATMGKLGGEKSLAVLRLIHDAPPLLAQIVERAVLRIERSVNRPTVASEETAPVPTIRIDRQLPGPSRVVLRCRAGLTAIVVEELRARGLIGGAKQLTAIEPTYVDFRDGNHPVGRVSFDWSRPLADLFAARTFSSLAIALPVSRSRDTSPDLAEVVAAALSNPRTRALFRSLAVDAKAVRYRLHFADGGHRRALVWQIAAAVRRSTPELVNDPKASPFQVEIFDRAKDGAPISLELLPRIVDPRFAYHLRDVPAASHPPVAAALSRLAEIGASDVVWDPFVGSGSELIEIALTTPCRQLFGTDLDEEAISVARENIAAAAIPDGVIELRAFDALRFLPPAPRLSRIVTNPPMGRRTRPGELSTFLCAFIDHAAARLAPRGRLVWISPQARITAPHAKSRGLRLLSVRSIDLHGFFGSLEVWEKP